MSSAITKYEGPVALAPASFEQACEFAGKLARAEGFIPRAFVERPHAILAAIMTGGELGIGPMESLRSIHIIDGRPMLSADLMLRLALRAGVRVEWLRTDAEEARCKLTRAGHPDHEHAFTIAEAKNAGLAGRGNWSKYPAAMLRARCISAALRAWCPDVIGAGVYVDGELTDDEPSPLPPERAREPEPAATEPAATEGGEDVVEGEVSCGAPDEPRTELDMEAELEPPDELGDCTTAEHLRGWLKAKDRGARIVRAKKVAGLMPHADRIGVPHAEVFAWLGLAERADDVGGEEAA